MGQSLSTYARFLLDMQRVNMVRIREDPGAIMDRGDILFHKTHSANIHVSDNGSRARRMQSYSKGICFSNRPIAINERVYLKIEDVSSNWNGVMKFGFTSDDPSTIDGSTLPAYSCPDLTDKDGYWAKMVPKSKCVKSGVVAFYCTHSGDVMCDVGGEEDELLSGVATDVPLYALFDIYGSTTSVQLIAPSYSNKLQQAGLKITFEEDSMSICDDATIPKAVMPCGHIMGEEAMTGYLKSAIGLINNSNGEYKFKCPECGGDWEYNLVNVVAQMSLEDQKEVEEKLAKNYIYKTQDNKQCGQCETMCYREDPQKQCLRCPCCSKSQGSEYDFCWTCGQQWKNATTSKTCGNDSCDGVDPRVHTLQNCNTKDIEFYGTTIKSCPEIRACPHCGNLIAHIDACKHMDCTSCHYSFCFSCLKGKENNKWQCGDWNIHCSPAPRQTAAEIVGAS